MTRSRIRALLFAIAALCCAALFAQSLQTLQQHALAAYKAKDFAAYLADTIRIEQQRPGHPIAVFNLAGAQALNGNAAAAAAALARLAEMQVWLDVAGETDFDGVRNDPAFARAAARVAAVREARKSSATVAFRFDDPDLITESIAYDPRSKSFFVSSVRKRRIIRVAADGGMSDFARSGSGSDAFDSPNGLAVDASRRLLWVATGASKRMEGFTAGGDGHAELLAFALDSGKLVKRLIPAGDENKHFFDSVAVLAGGDVVVTDSTGSIYRLPSGTGGLQLLVPPGTLRSPQAIAPLDAKTFFVADYGSGIFRVDAASGATERLTAAVDAALYGIDGLSFRDGSLIAIVNGYRPNRVQRLRLDKSRHRIVGAEPLEMNTPQLDEPTNGIIVGRTYYFVASSQGHRFDGDAIEPAPAEMPAILKIDLGK
jgi:sugar lactone lactonase YvrE